QVTVPMTTSEEPGKASAAPRSQVSGYVLDSAPQLRISFLTLPDSLMFQSVLFWIRLLNRILKKERDMKTMFQSVLFWIRLLNQARSFLLPAVTHRPAG